MSHAQSSANIRGSGFMCVHSTYTDDYQMNIVYGLVKVLFGQDKVGTLFMLSDDVIPGPLGA